MNNLTTTSTTITTTSTTTISGEIIAWTYLGFSLPDAPGLVLGAPNIYLAALLRLWTVNRDLSNYRATNPFPAKLCMYAIIGLRLS